MGLFENRESSAMVLTGVFLGTGTLSAASQNVVSAGKEVITQENLTSVLLSFLKNNCGKIIALLTVTGLLVYLFYKMRSSTGSEDIKENIDKFTKNVQSNKNIDEVKKNGQSNKNIDEVKKQDNSIKNENNITEIKVKEVHPKNNEGPNSFIKNENEKKITEKEQEKEVKNEEADEILEKLKNLANELGFGNISFLDKYGTKFDRFEYYGEDNPKSYLVQYVLGLISKAKVLDFYKYLYVVNVVAVGLGLQVDVNNDWSYFSFDREFDDFHKEALKLFGKGKIKTTSESNKKLATLLEECYEYLSEFYNNLNTNYQRQVNQTGSKESHFVGNSFGREPGELENSKIVVNLVSRIVDRAEKLSNFFKNISNGQKNEVITLSEHK